jgi:6-phosphogluconolactonase
MFAFRVRAIGPSGLGITGRRMRMKLRWVQILVVLLLAIISISCSNNNSSPTSGTGYLWLTAQGNTTVQAYTINLSNGSLSLNSSALATANAPTSILITPKGDAAFISNSGTGGQSIGGGISAYTVNSDGTLKAAGSTITVVDTVPAPNTNTCANPMGTAIDPGGKFLFVACQGTFSDPNSGAVYVFSISGTSLAPVGVRTPTNSGGSTGSGAVSVAVSASGNYLYVANQFANTVSSFQISSSGALTALGTYPAGISPSAIFASIAQGTTTKAGLYLYVANAGSSNISAFSICDSANASGCSTANGVLTPITGSPFPAQPGPVAIAMDPTAAFLYVADAQANEISEYSWSSGTGAITPLSTATISAGGQPVSLAVRAGVAATATVAGTDYMYVTNLNGSTMSVYSLNTTSGSLNVLGSPVATPSQPSAVTVR